MLQPGPHLLVLTQLSVRLLTTTTLTPIVHGGGAGCLYDRISPYLQIIPYPPLDWFCTEPPAATEIVAPQLGMSLSPPIVTHQLLFRLPPLPPDLIMSPPPLHSPLRSAQTLSSRCRFICAHFQYNSLIPPSSARTPATTRPGSILYPPGPSGPVRSFSFPIPHVPPIAAPSIQSAILTTLTHYPQSSLLPRYSPWALSPTLGAWAVLTESYISSTWGSPLIFCSLSFNYSSDLF